MVLILTTKAKPAAFFAANSALSTAIDELGEMTGAALKAIAEIKKQQAKLEPYTIKSKQVGELINAITAYDADAEFVEKGLKYQAVVGKKKKEREILDMRAVRKKLGDKTFFEVAKVTLADIDKYLTEAEQLKNGLIKVERTTRKFEVTPIK